MSTMGKLRKGPVATIRRFDVGLLALTMAEGMRVAHSLATAVLLPQSLFSKNAVGVMSNAPKRAPSFGFGTSSRW